VVARSKAGFKSMGFWYTDFSTTITVETVEVTRPTASVHFKELTEEHQASAANGPSNVPSGYSVPQTATFQASADGWQLDSIAPSVHGAACLCPSSRTEDDSVGGGAGVSPPPNRDQGAAHHSYLRRVLAFA